MGALLKRRRTRFAAPSQEDDAAARTTVLDLELSRPLPPFPELLASGTVAPRAWLVVRLYGEPLGIERVDATVLDEPAALVQLLRSRWSAHAQARGTTLDGVPSESLATGETSFSVDHRLYLTVASPVSVVVPTHERPDDIRRCLESLVAQDHPSFTVWVVDNAPSSDLTRGVVSSFKDRLDVRYLCEPVAGASRARNLALEQDLGEFSAWIDDDEVADRLWLSELMRALESRPGIDGVSGVVVPAELETQAQIWFEELGGHSDRGFQADEFSPATRHRFNPLFPIPSFGISGNSVLRTESMRRVGGFDQALGPGTRTHGGEDMVLFTEILRRGGTVLHHPYALTRHFHRREVNGLDAQVRGYGMGLTAFYTSLAVNDPRVIPEMLRVVVPGMRHMLSSSTAEREPIAVDLPPGLRTAKLRGMLAGPVAYLRERFRHR